MTTLHTLNSGPHSTAYADCLQLIGDGDTVLLLGDGVYCAAASTASCAELTACGATLYVLSDHARARGVNIPSPPFTGISISGFAELTERCHKQLAWY